DALAQPRIPRARRPHRAVAESGVRAVRRTAEPGPGPGDRPTLFPADPRQPGARGPGRAPGRGAASRSAASGTRRWPPAATHPPRTPAAPGRPTPRTTHRHATARLRTR